MRSVFVVQVTVDTDDPTDRREDVETACAIGVDMHCDWACEVIACTSTP